MSSTNPLSISYTSVHHTALFIPIIPESFFSNTDHLQVLFPGADHIDQWNQITSVLGSPDEEFVDRLMDTVKAYIRNKPKVSALLDLMQWHSLSPFDLSLIQ